MFYLVKFEVTTYRQVCIIMDVFSRYEHLLSFSDFNVRYITSDDYDRFYCGGFCVCFMSSNFELFFDVLELLVDNKMFHEFGDDYYMLRNVLSFVELKGLDKE